MKDSISTQKQNLSGLIVLVLFGVFAVCILAVLLSGTSVYDRLVTRDENAFEDRTATQYLTTKIHSAQNAESVSIVSFQGNDAISIAESFDGEAYRTLLYCYDGWLYELFQLSEEEMGPDAGEKVLPAKSLTASIKDDLLSISITDAKGEQKLFLSLRSGEVNP